MSEQKYTLSAREFPVADKKAKPPKFNYPGVTLRVGPSDLTGDEIATIAVFNSTNAKTGNVVQVYYLPIAEHPMDAIKSGLDQSICGNCTLRPLFGRKTKCYVRKGHGPAKVWATFHNNRYPLIDNLLPALQQQVMEILASKPIRLGAYGDPAADVESSKRLAKIGGRNTLAYTHQWKLFPELKPFAMASVDNLEDYQLAKSEGWRSYRHQSLDRLQYHNDGRFIDIHNKEWNGGYQSEILCPNTTHKIQCVDCKLCNGANGRNGKDIVVASIGA